VDIQNKIVAFEFQLKIFIAYIRNIIVNL